MSKRTYGFALPYDVSGVYALGLSKELSGNRPEVTAAMAKIQTINPAFAAKLKSAGFWHAITITQADLDSLPDDVWTPVANQLGLKWKHA